MRLFALCILALSLTTQGVGQQSKANPQEPAAGRQAAADTNYPPASRVSQPQSNDQATDQKNATSNSEHKGFLPSPTTVSAYSTFFILLTTIAYAIISYCMFVKVGEQVGVAKSAAKDAKASADALVEIERPWIQVFTNARDITIPESQPQSNTRVYFWPKLGSVGRTPARFTYGIFKAHLVPKDPNVRRDLPPPLPDTPNYTDGTSADKHALIIPGTAVKPFPVDISEDDWKAVHRRELFLYVYGLARYSGVGVDHVTCFCEVYWVPPDKSDPGGEGFRVTSNIPDIYLTMT